MVVEIQVFYPALLTLLDAHTGMKYYLNSLSGRCVMVKTSVFQTEDAGSIPAARSKILFRHITYKKLETKLLRR